MIVKVNPAYSALEGQISLLPENFGREGETLHTGRNKVKTMVWGGIKVVAKKYKKPNFFLKLQFIFLYNCKAKKAYKFGNLFNQAGLHSPTPVAYAIDGRWPIIKDSYFVCLPVEGVCLKETLKAGDKATIKALASELAKMHMAGLMHGDLNLTNIYLDDKGEFHFIDTNRSKIRKNPSADVCAENLMRLSHDRELLLSITSEYAVLRGWKGTKFNNRVIYHLDAFERKKSTLKRLKKAFGIGRHS